MSDITKEIFQAYEGTQKVFTLNGKQLTVPANLDTFNYYKGKFYHLAKYCTDNAVEQYKSSVTNLERFVNCFPDIYNENLNTVISKAMDILIAEEIYNYSAEMFEKRHKRSFCSGIAYYKQIGEGIKETAANNSQTAGVVANLATSLFSTGSSGLDNLFCDVIGNSSNTMTEEQQAALFNCMAPQDIFNCVLCDYCDVVTTMCDILNENGKDIWLYEENTDGMDNVIKSIANPNFPQDKVAEVLFDCLLKKPYDPSIYKTLEDKFGRTDEINAIFDYFNYDVYNNNFYSEEDFPKQTIAEDTNAEAQNKENENQNNSGNTVNDNTQNPENKKKGFFSSLKDEVKKMDVDKLKNDAKEGLKIGAGVLAAGALLGLGGLSKSNNNSNNNGNNANGITRRNYFMTPKCQQTGLHGKKSCAGCTLLPYCTHGGSY